MGTNDHRKDWPILVWISLFGVTSRVAAWAWVWFSVALSVGCFIAAFWLPWPALFVGIGVYMILAANAYYWSLRWVDQHGGWS
jgi:hypothetical protein